MRERRMLLGLTQQQMAELIGVTYQQAHKYEKGINRIAGRRLSRIAQGLGVEIGFFFEMSGRSGERRAQPAAAPPARAGAQLHRPAEPQASGSHLQPGAGARPCGPN